MVTLVLSCTFSKKRRLIGWKLRIFLPHSHLTPSLGVNPIEFLDQHFNMILSGKLESWAICRCRFCDPSWCCFHSTPACDGRTDRQTDRPSDFPTMASTGLHILCWRPLKIEINLLNALWYQLLLLSSYQNKNKKKFSGWKYYRI